MDSDHIFVLCILFLTVVVPVWIVFYYIDRFKRTKGGDQPTETLSAPELQTMAGRAKQMDERIRALETILDAEVPGWRQKL